MAITILDEDLDHPWLRQPWDTEDSWHALAIYRAMRPPRSMGLLAGEVGRSTGQLTRWSAEYVWDVRLLAYDRWAEQRRIDEEQRILGETAQERFVRHLRPVQESIAVAAQAVHDWVRRIAKGHGVPELRPEAIIRILEKMIILERLIQGETTERTEHSVDLGRLSVAELELMRDLEIKAGGRG